MSERIDQKRLALAPIHPAGGEQIALIALIDEDFGIVQRRHQDLRVEAVILS